MKAKVLFGMILAAGCIFWSCQKDEVLNLPEENLQLKSAPGQSVCQPEYISLTTRQNTDVGYLVIFNDIDFLYVTFVANDSYTISETHLWAGVNEEDVPKNGNDIPTPGRFPFHSAISTDHSFTINLSDIYLKSEILEGKPVYLFAHSVLTNNETKETESAWSAGETFETQRWGSYSVVQCCNPEGNPSGCYPHVANCGNMLNGELYYDNTSGGDQNIYADNGEIAGTLIYNNDKFYFNFDQDWMFTSLLSDPLVLIYGYLEPGGDSTLLYSDDPDSNFGGPDTVSVPYYPYYTLELKIQYCQ